MSENKGNQYKKPDSTPSEEHAEKPDELRQNSRENIIGGARDEGQLESLKPAPETEGKIDSQPEKDIDDGGEKDKH